MKPAAWASGGRCTSFCSSHPAVHPTAADGKNCGIWDIGQVRRDGPRIKEAVDAYTNETQTHTHTGKQEGDPKKGGTDP